MVRENVRFTEHLEMHHIWAYMKHTILTVPALLCVCLKQPLDEGVGDHGQNQPFGAQGLISFAFYCKNLFCF